MKPSSSEIKTNLKIAAALNKLTNLSVYSKTTEDFLKHSLYEISKLNSREKSKGLAYILDADKKNLVLTANRNLSAKEIKTCANIPVIPQFIPEIKARGVKKEGPLINALSKKLSLKNFRSKRLLISVKSSNKTLGLIFTTIEKDLADEKTTRRFMSKFADLAAETIARKTNEAALLFEKTASTSIAELSNIYLSSDKISIKDISTMILKKAKELTESKFGFVGHLDQKTGHMIVPTLTANKWNKCRIKNKSIVFKRFGKVWGWKKPIISNDLKNDKRAGGTPKGHVKIKNFLSAPAISNNKFIGIVAVANSAGDYTQTDLAYIKRLADFCAITLQRKFAEDKLKENKKTLQTIFDTAIDMMIIKDANHKFVKINNACADFFNVSAEKTIGKTNYDIFPKKTAKKETEEEEIVLKKGKTLTVDTIRKTVKGTKIINAIKTPIKNKKGETTGLVAILRDVTELRKLQQKFIRKQAIKEAGKITDGVAHDFNNILAAINGYSTLMLSEIDDKNSMQAEIKAIKQAVLRAVNITNKLQKAP